MPSGSSACKQCSYKCANNAYLLPSQNTPFSFGIGTKKWVVDQKDR